MAEFSTAGTTGSRGIDEFLRRLEQKVERLEAQIKALTPTSTAIAQLSTATQSQVQDNQAADVIFVFDVLNPVPQPVNVTIDFDCTILSATLLAEPDAGNIVMDVLKSTYAGWPTTASIVGASPPTLSSAQKSQDTVLTGWTTHISAGDILQASVVSALSIAKIVLILKVLRTI